MCVRKLTSQSKGIKQRRVERDLSHGAYFQGVKQAISRPVTGNEVIRRLLGEIRVQIRFN